MPKGIPLVTCKRCPKTREQAGGFTRSGYCIDCANALLIANRIALKQHRGPYFDHWRRRMAASVGGILVDEIQAEA